MGWSRGTGRRPNGQTTVEFALNALIFFTTLLFCLSIGLVAFEEQRAVAAAAKGARVGVEADPSNPGQAAGLGEAQNAAAGVLGGSFLTSQVVKAPPGQPCHDPGDKVLVCAYLDPANGGSVTVEIKGNALLPVPGLSYPIDEVVEAPPEVFSR